MLGGPSQRKSAGGGIAGGMLARLFSVFSGSPASHPRERRPSTSTSESTPRGAPTNTGADFSLRARPPRTPSATTTSSDGAYDRKLAALPDIRQVARSSPMTSGSAWWTIGMLMCGVVLGIVLSQLALSFQPAPSSLLSSGGTPPVPVRLTEAFTYPAGSEDLQPRTAEPQQAAACPPQKECPPPSSVEGGLGLAAGSLSGQCTQPFFEHQWGQETRARPAPLRALPVTRVVSPALDAPSSMLLGTQAHFQRIAGGLDHYFAPYDRRPEDAAEIDAPWSWLRDDPTKRQQEALYAQRLFQTRLTPSARDAALLAGSDITTGSTAFAFDTRFTRFRGGMLLKPPPAITEGDTDTPGAISLTDWQLCHSPLAGGQAALYHRLPCPIIWQQPSGMVRWNKAAERGFYNLLKEQQFPSQHLLPTQIDSPAGASPAVPPAIDCTKMRYMFLFALGPAHGFFSRWKHFLTGWRQALALDTSRIVVWDLRRMAVKHSVEADTLEEGIARYLQSPSVCATHPWVLERIREHHDLDIYFQQPERYARTHGIHALMGLDQVLDPKYTDVQLLRIGMDNVFMTSAHHEAGPHRAWLFSWQAQRQQQTAAYQKETGHTDVQVSNDVERMGREHPIFPYYTARQTSYPSEAARRQYERDHLLSSEHIYPLVSPKSADRDSANGKETRGYVYGEFVKLMLTAFAFTLTPDIQVMARQLEVHWAQEVEDEEVERQRNDAYLRLMQASTAAASASPSDAVPLDRWLAWEPAWAAALEMQGVAARDANPPQTNRSQEGSETPTPAYVGADGQRLSLGSPHAEQSSRRRPFVDSLPQCYTPGADPTDVPVSARHPSLVARSPSAALSPSVPLGYTSSLHASSFGSLHPMCAVAIRRGDKMAEDSFYIEHGHFRPVSMFVWRVYQEERRQTNLRRQQWRQAIEAEEIAAQAENRPVHTPQPTMPDRFKYRSMFVLTDDVPAFEEILACSRLPAVEVRDDAHWDQLVQEAVAQERLVTQEQTRVGLLDLERRGGKVVMDSDAIFQNPPAPPSGEAGCPSPLNRLLLPGVKVVYNVYAPQRCYHPFVRVGFQQFLVAFAFVVRNVRMWVGPLDSSVTQVLHQLTHIYRQAQLDPNGDAPTNVQTEKRMEYRMEWD